MLRTIFLSSALENRIFLFCWMLASAHVINYSFYYSYSYFEATQHKYVFFKKIKRNIIFIRGRYHSLFIQLFLFTHSLLYLMFQDNNDNNNNSFNFLDFVFLFQSLFLHPGIAIHGNYNRIIPILSFLLYTIYQRLMSHHKWTFFLHIYHTSSPSSLS